MYMYIHACVCTNKPAESALVRTDPSALDNKYGCSFSFPQQSLRSLVTCSACLCGYSPLPHQQVFGYCHCSNVVYVAISRRDSFKADLWDSGSYNLSAPSSGILPDPQVHSYEAKMFFGPSSGLVWGHRETKTEVTRNLKVWTQDNCVF